MPTAMRSRIAPPAISVMRRLQTRPAVPTADLAKGRGKRNCRRKLPTNRAPRLARGKPPTTRAQTAHLTTPLLTAMIVMSASRMASCGGGGGRRRQGVFWRQEAQEAVQGVRRHMCARMGAEERERLQGVWQLIPHERRSSGGVCRGRSASVCPKAHFELTGATLVALTRVDSKWAPLHRWHLAFEIHEKAGAGTVVT